MGSLASAGSTAARSGPRGDPVSARDACRSAPTLQKAVRSRRSDRILKWIRPGKARGWLPLQLAWDLHKPEHVESGNAMATQLGKILSLPARPVTPSSDELAASAGRERRARWVVLALILGSLSLYWGGVALF